MVWAVSLTGWSEFTEDVEALLGYNDPVDSGSCQGLQRANVLKHAAAKDRKINVSEGFACQCQPCIQKSWQQRDRINMGVQ
jgi:hypothetical protein